MVNEITNTMLLEHMQEMKEDLQEQIAVLDRKIGGVERKVEGVDKNTANLSEEMRKGFEDASQHRQALQEDLEASMRMLGKHEEKFAKL